ALIIGFSARGRLGAQLPSARNTATDQVDSWIVIADDETVTGYVGKCDFGQGFRTVQRQLIAEELNVRLDRVKIVICDTALTPDQGVSSGSQGHPTQFGNGALRQALATGRDALFQMASTQLSAPVSDLMSEDGAILVKSDRSRRATYGRLVAGRQFNL